MNYFQIFLLIVLVLNLLIDLSNGAKILFFFGFSTYSHRILVWPLVEELVRRGHEVTYFSSSPNKNPNPKVHDFVPSGFIEFNKNVGLMNKNLLHAKLENRLVEMWYFMPKVCEQVCEVILKSPNTQEFFKKSSFDLVIIDSLYNDCGFAFVHKSKAKYILFGTTTIFPWNYDSNGISPETSWIPDIINYFPGEIMSFSQRLLSTVEYIRWHITRQYFYFPRVEEIIRNELGLVDMPPISEMEKNVSLFFINTHFSEEYARALPPFVIPLGGLQITNTPINESSISKNLLDFISKSGNNGFIYISFGSDVKISTLPRDKLMAIFEALKNTKLPCIWKWDAEIPKNIPKNILIINWVPQQALLSHSKIKMMISHGGLLSIHEAITHKVPLIVLPVFAEQDFNAERVHRKGLGIKLDIRDFTQTNLEYAISEIISNPKYREQIQEMARVFHDRMNTGLETAVWYTEYVLRHNHTLMKPYSIYQTWYERRLIDIWFFIFLVIFLLTLVILYILKVVISFSILRILGTKSIVDIKDTNTRVKTKVN